MSTCSMCWMSTTFLPCLDLLDLNYWTILTCEHPAYVELAPFFLVFLDLLDLNYLTILACQHLACLDLAWLVLACRLPWLDLLDFTFFLNGVTCLTWLGLFDSSHLTWLDLYPHVKKDRESSSGTPSSGVIRNALPENRLVIFGLFKSTEMSWPFHFMSCLATTMLCSFGYPLGV